MTPRQKQELAELEARWDAREVRYGGLGRPRSGAALSAAKLYRLAETSDLRGAAHTWAVMRIKDWGE